MMEYIGRSLSLCGNFQDTVAHRLIISGTYFNSIISSLQMVSFSTPSLVTTHEFSIHTGPMPGNTIFGSSANTMPGSTSCFMRGASTGISFISNPMP